MIHSARFTALLDANVLYPITLRDNLMNLAELELYIPKWTAEIHDEWIRSVLEKRADLTRERLERTQRMMESAFPDSNITNYEELMEGLSLPDKKDRHVLAAAIRGNVDVIVTFNLKDFPINYLKTYEVEVQDPDEFITNLISLNEAESLEAFNNMVTNFQKPPRTKAEVMHSLKKCGLFKSMSLLNEIR